MSSTSYEPEERENVRTASSVPDWSWLRAALIATVAVATAALMLIATWPATATAQVVTGNPVLFVTQNPVAGFGTSTAVFGNHQATIPSAPRGGDLVLRLPDGSLRFLTAEAGYGNAGMQGAGSIAVREPTVHWSGQKALFSMVVGAPTAQYQINQYRWQIYEVSGFGAGETAQIRYVAGQPQDFNNVSPIYATDGRILFISDRPSTGLPHHYPQRDEYESTPIVAGIYSLDETSGEVVLLEHAPSGVTSLSLDSFGRVIFTKWDHLQRDQQGDAPGTAATYGAFTYASEAADAPKTTSLAGAEVFPEPRTMNDPSYSAIHPPHSFNHFLPWEMNQDGTAEETLNHIGRQEIGGAYTDGSFTNDPNLSYYTPQSTHDNTLYIQGSTGLFHLREDPTSPGDFLTTHAQEFGTASGGTLMRITGAPGVNPENMILSRVTSGTDVPASTGYFRNPLPMSDGQLLAVHTAATGYATNLGTTAAPNWNYAYRIKVLESSGGFYAPVANLTGGIVKNLSWWTPDSLATYHGPLWELDPVEVVARPVPPPRQSVLPAIEAAVFADEGVDVEEFRDYLRQHELALIVSRDVTMRDRGDLQQPFNLAVPGGTQTLGAGGTIYEVAHFQIFQGDYLRGYGGIDSPSAGRRLLARPMHGPYVSQSPGSPSGAVKLAPDGSMAAIVPARRALTWQLTDSDGDGIVRERNWISFQSGEIRVCANCHGSNTAAQNGQGEPQNEPLALRSLLQEWASGGGGGDACTSGIPLQRARLRASAAPFRLVLSGAAVLPEPFDAVDPTVHGVRIVIDDLVDATIPGGAGWTLKSSGWIYENAAGAVAGITSIRIKNGSGSEPGRLQLKVRGAGPATTLPSADAVQASVTFGSDSECASAQWNGPGEARPACSGDAARLVCR
ncbi:MAG TPA: hypothetical protein VEC57_18610 [Candidatus Limnocylindrales bacterium]|nr:hypothetical protein [Candidatus Limnocylindrales bacterium]